MGDAAGRGVKEPAELELLVRVEVGELGDPFPVLAYLAGQRVAIPSGELNDARRRALLVLAAGGDPRRDPGLDDPAVKTLAGDLETGERRAELAAGIDELVVAARELPSVRSALLQLAGDVDLAWRLLALALLADDAGGEVATP
jgi:hypothetical protein